jgi:hypothetical protein
MSQLLNCVRGFRNWWYSGVTVPRHWHIYFVVHLLIVVYCGVFAFLDSHGCYFLDRGAIEFVSEAAAVYSLPAPLVTVGILLSACKGGPSYIAFALVDVLLCIVHYLAVLIACS